MIALKKESQRRMIDRDVFGVMRNRDRKVQEITVIPSFPVYAWSVSRMLCNKKRKSINVYIIDVLRKWKIIRVITRYFFKLNNEFICMIIKEF